MGVRMNNKVFRKVFYEEENDQLKAAGYTVIMWEAARIVMIIPI